MRPGCCLFAALRGQRVLWRLSATLNLSITHDINYGVLTYNQKQHLHSTATRLKKFTKGSVDLDFYGKKINEKTSRERRRSKERNSKKTSSANTDGSQQHRVAGSSGSVKFAKSDARARKPTRTKQSITRQPAARYKKTDEGEKKFNAGRSPSLSTAKDRSVSRISPRKNLSTTASRGMVKAKYSSRSPLPRESRFSGAKKTTRDEFSVSRKIANAIHPSLKKGGQYVSNRLEATVKQLPMRDLTEVRDRITKRRAAKSPIQAETKQMFAISTDRLDLFVSCLPGLEPFLSAELTALEIDHLVEQGGALLVSPKASDLMDCHLYLGTASHVLLRCGKPFGAHGLAELRRKVAKTEWGSILQEDSHLDIRVSSFKSDLYHTGAVEERVKLGIYESLGRDLADDRSPNDRDMRSDESDVKGNKEANIVPLTVRVNRDLVHISIDTSRTPLHQRGYRLETAKAPLREDLAYAMLYCSGWQPTHSRLRYESPNCGRLYSALLDPFCGSGTLAIEAAAIAAGLPPGRLRPAPMEGTKLYDKAKWDSLVKNALSPQQRGESLEFFISASDRDSGAIRAAQNNAKRAGVRDYIDIQQGSLSSSNWFANPFAAPDSILVATNPPFGKRISPIVIMQRGENPLLSLYQKVGHQINKLKEKKEKVGAVVLAKDLRLARRTALDDFDVAFTSHHGGMPVSALVMGHIFPNEEAID